MRKHGLQGWWREQIIARIQENLGEIDNAIEEFNNWADEKPSFARYYFIARFLIEIGKDDEAVVFLKNAVNYKLRDIEGSGTMAWGYAVQAVTYAYINELFDLVMSICEGSYNEGTMASSIFFSPWM